MQIPRIALLPRLELNRPRDAHEVLLDDAHVALPPVCASCGELGGQFFREAKGQTTLLVPYCGSCARGVLRSQTEQLAAALASVILVVTLLLTLPRMFVELTLPAYGAVIAAAGALPLWLLYGTRHVVSPPASASGKAAFLRDSRHLVCFNADWARQLATSADREAVPVRRRERRINSWMWLSSAAALAVAPNLHALNYPDVVVLNFGDADVDIVVDGRVVGNAEPTSLESEHAGARLRVAAGRHEFQAKSPDGALVERFTARLEPGALHLMTVAGGDYCFWLEEDQYGRAGPEPTRRRRLVASEPLWVVPTRIDSWFSPNPTASSDQRSTGGTMTALRHARCADLPPLVPMP